VGWCVRASGEMMRVATVGILACIALFALLAGGCPGRLAFCNDDADCGLNEVCVLGSCVDEVEDDAGVNPDAETGCAAPLEGGTFRVCGSVGIAAGSSAVDAREVRPVASSPAGRATMTGGAFTVR
jgi:hypothetical protein